MEDTDPVVDVFTRAIVGAVASYAPEARQQVERAVLAEARRIAVENEAFAVDAPGRRWVALCSVLLAGYRMLVPHVGDGPAIAVLQSAITRPFTSGITAFLHDRFGISQEAPGDAFERIAEAFLSRGEARFGGGFSFVPDGREADRSFTKITRCLFNDFFRANHASDLTSVCCAMDKVWAEELAHPRYGVRFERPTTLAAGADACRFRFFRS